MFWFLLIFVAVIGYFSYALIKKSRNYSNGPYLNDLNSAAKTMKSDLYKLQFAEGAEKYGEKVSQQFEELQNKYNAYLQTLNQKFSPGELTYDRYLVPVQQLQQNLNENFKKIKEVVIFIGNNALLVKELNKKSVDSLTVEEKNKIEIHKKYQNHFDELHEINHKALNELDRLIFSLAQINTNSSADPKQLEYMVKELGVLAERAKKYTLY